MSSVPRPIATTPQDAEDVECGDAENNRGDGWIFIGVKIRNEVKELVGAKGVKCDSTQQLRQQLFHACWNRKKPPKGCQMVCLTADRAPIGRSNRGEAIGTPFAGLLIPVATSNQRRAVAIDVPKRTSA